MTSNTANKFWTETGNNEREVVHERRLNTLPVNAQNVGALNGRMKFEWTYISSLLCQSILPVDASRRFIQFLSVSQGLSTTCTNSSHRMGTGSVFILFKGDCKERFRTQSNPPTEHIFVRCVRCHFYPTTHRVCSFFGKFRFPVKLNFTRFGWERILSADRTKWVNCEGYRRKPDVDSSAEPAAILSASNHRPGLPSIHHVPQQPSPSSESNRFSSKQLTIANSAACRLVDEINQRRWFAPPLKSFARCNGLVVSALAPNLRCAVCCRSAGRGLESKSWRI